MQKGKKISGIHGDLIVQVMNVATWEWNLLTKKVKINDRWAEMIGYTKDELKPITIDTLRDNIHPDDLAMCYEAYNNLVAEKQSFYNLAIRRKHKDGHYIWVLDSRKITKRDESGNVLQIIGTHVDITDQKALSDALKSSEKNLRQIINNTKDIIYRITTDGDFTFLSSAWTKTLGHSTKDLIGQSFKPFVHPDDLKVVEDFFRKIQRGAKNQTLTRYRLLHQNGYYLYFETTASEIVEDSHVVRFAGTTRDITDLTLKQREVEYLSYHDQLTGCFNRHYLKKVEADIIDPKNFPLCIISIDLNNLKEINDNLGHQMGDEVMVRASNLIKNAVVNTDYLFRMGGDEFLVFLPNTDEAKALQIRQTINEAINDYKQKNYPLSLAYGFYIKTDPSSNIYDEIRIADQYMYTNKAKSKLR